VAGAAANPYVHLFHKTSVGSNQMEVSAAFYSDNDEDGSHTPEIKVRSDVNDAISSYYFGRAQIGYAAATGRWLYKRIGAPAVELASMAGPGKQSEWHIQVEACGQRFRLYDRPNGGAGWTQRLQAYDSDFWSGTYCGAFLFYDLPFGDDYQEMDDFCANALTGPCVTTTTAGA
jgi:hypothetical protein